MLTRILTAVIALCVLIPVLIFASFELFAGITVLKLALALVTCIAVMEAADCIGTKKPLLYIPALVASAFLILTTGNSLSHYAPVMILLLFLFLFLGVLRHKEFKVDTIMVFFAFSYYIVASFGALLLVYERLDGFFFPLVFFGAWVTDTFAYFSGFFFGKHKLIPEVSPKKTVEGAVGGTLFCILSFIIYGIVKGCDAKSVVLLAFIGLAAAVVSQLGDLSASLIKRHYGIKDYGKLFPGHGGVLDRFDSILAVSVLLYLITELPVEVFFKL
jgi:phosphatidate cytidylyltransferase